MRGEGAVEYKYSDRFIIENKFTSKSYHHSLSPFSSFNIMDRGRLFLKSSSRPKKQRRSSTPKVYPQPTIFRSNITAKASPVLPVLTISSECWEKSNPAVYIHDNSADLNSLHMNLSKEHSVHPEVSPICPFSYKELPVKGDGVSGVLCVTLSSNPLEANSGPTTNKFPRPDIRLKQARDSLIEILHPTKALFIKYTNELLCQYGKRTNFEGFTGNTEIKDSFGICPSTNPKEIRESKCDVEELLPPRLSGPRNIRSNQEYLRISLAESSMVKANKILRPLKPRHYLPRRGDFYAANRPSSLSLCYTSDSEGEDSEEMEL
ncbi:hypothetical protein K7432_013796 [Basidiobolus ranarum]|uniref:Uncharacterized protein n=1 Tax=Basidiobolus ranarum TaxID=34480 RepID=A0ABR2VQB7_9FUNG